MRETTWPVECKVLSDLHRKCLLLPIPEESKSKFGKLRLFTTLPLSWRWEISEISPNYLQDGAEELVPEGLNAKSDTPFLLL